MSAISASLLFAPWGPDGLARSFGAALGAEQGVFTLREFPDGESHVQVQSACAGRRCVILASLDHPNSKIVPLLLLADTLRDLGATHIALVAPYLSYMRQDKRFHDGEGVTSRYFASWLSRHFDSLVTMDPHLHRHPTLDAIYSIPSRVVHAAPLLADWIAANVSRPLIIGPDSESEQWVREVGARAGAPYAVAAKTRRGDRDVSIELPANLPDASHTPVLVDDILSTGRTLAAVARQLHDRGYPPAICMAVHGLFCGDAEAELQRAGVAQIITTNAVAHATNALDAGPLLAQGLRGLLPV